MSVGQILRELPKLTPEERREIFEQLAELETQHTYKPSPEESAQSMKRSALLKQVKAFQPLRYANAYIARDNPKAAEQFGYRLISPAELLGTFPKLGRLVHGKRNVRVLLKSSGQFAAEPTGFLPSCLLCLALKPQPVKLFELRIPGNINSSS
jgi:plasmid stabilization system protein ParE